MGKVNILAIGDHVTKTGFSRVLENILKNLPAEEYNISVLAVNYMGDPHELPYKVYPASLGGDVYGLGRLENLIAVTKPDIIFMLNDVWVLQNYLKAIKEIYKNIRPKVVTYFPIDGKDHSRSWYEHFDIVDRAVVYNTFSQEVASEANTRKKFEIIPHGVDSSVFYKLEGNKRDLKKAYYPNKPDFYEDSFIVLNANRNQPRKRLDITMRAFKYFSEGKPKNVKLYMHCGVQDASVNIIELAKRYDIEDRLILTSIKNTIMQIPEAKLNMIYNVTDVGINTSLGEGWGLTNFEHSLTGAPQIVPGNSANIELFQDCGLLVPPICDWTHDLIMTTGSIVRPEDVAEKLELLYTDKELYNTLSEKALAKFKKPEYEWKNIAMQWDKLFKEVIAE